VTDMFLNGEHCSNSSAAEFTGTFIAMTQMAVIQVIRSIQLRSHCVCLVNIKEKKEKIMTFFYYQFAGHLSSVLIPLPCNEPKITTSTYLEVQYEYWSSVNRLLCNLQYFVQHQRPLLHPNVFIQRLIFA
jgi:hypothetical protein